jgi:PEP-CTERM motif
MKDYQKVFTTMAASALVAMLLFSTPTTARAAVTNLNSGETINLATVIDNGLALQIGDKQFGDFFFSYTDHGATNIDLVAANVNVTALSNVVGFGVSFTEPLSASGSTTRDIVLKYTALVTDPNFKISDIHLSITGAAFGTGYGIVGEDVFDDGWGLTNVGHLQAGVFGLDLGIPNQLTDQADIVPPVSMLWVQKDVTVTGNGPNGLASITIIDQTFSQVPEPSTALLVGLGLLGVVALKRTRKS